MLLRAVMAAAHVKEFEEEIVIIRIAISLPSQSLYAVVDALDFPCRDSVGGMCDDAFEVIEEEPPEPLKVLIPCGIADLNDFCIMGPKFRPVMLKR